MEQGLPYFFVATGIIGPILLVLISILKMIKPEFVFLRSLRDELNRDEGDFARLLKEKFRIWTNTSSLDKISGLLRGSPLKVITNNTKD